MNKWDAIVLMLKLPWFRKKPLRPFMVPLQKNFQTYHDVVAAKSIVKVYLGIEQRGIRKQINIIQGWLDDTDECETMSTRRAFLLINTILGKIEDGTLERLEYAEASSYEKQKAEK